LPSNFVIPAGIDLQFIHLLEKHRICWVWADTSPLNERNLAPFEFSRGRPTFLYVRLLGDYTTKYDRDGKHRHRYGKLLWKREAAMESWALKIERQLSDVRAVYAYVNNHFEGFALESAQRLAERLGLRAPFALHRSANFGGRSQATRSSIVGQPRRLPGLLVGKRERLPNLFQGAAVAHLYPYRICSAPK
jgi:hypothetical protein